MLSIPTENDWGNWHVNLDQSFAHDLYFGKSNSEMNAHFLNAPIEAAGELQFIASIPFQYYVIGFRDSVLSKAHPEPLDVSDAASSFMRLILVRIKDNPEDIAFIKNELMPSLKYIAGHQNAYEADINIYGSFEDIYNEIQAGLKL